MQLKFSTLLLSLVCFFSACNDSVTTRARIFERKILPNDSLMIYYSFQSKDSLMKDSALVQKDTVLTDSVDIHFAVESPEKSQILMP